MSTCYWLDLQTLGSQPIMPKNLSDHCLQVPQRKIMPLFIVFTNSWALIYAPHILTRYCIIHNKHTHTKGSKNFAVVVELLFFALCTLKIQPSNLMHLFSSLTSSRG